MNATFVEAAAILLREGLEAILVLAALAIWYSVTTGMQSLDAIAARPGWDRISAVRGGRIHEMDGADILSPGPSLLIGLRRLHELMQEALDARE